MPHWYLKDGTRFAPLKKDGTPYQNIPLKLVKEAGAVRGVTDILKYCGDKGWMQRYFSVLAVDSTISEHDPSIGDDIWKLRAQAEFTKRSEAASAEGTRIHGLIDDWLKGKKVPENDKEARLLEGINAVLSSCGVLAEGSRELEKTFYVECDGLAYGGTRDLRARTTDGRPVQLDWKTVVRSRPPRIDELAQIAAYTAPEDRWHPGIMAADVYVSQETMRVEKTEWWTVEQLKFGWEYLKMAHRIMMMNEEFGEMI